MLDGDEPVKDEDVAPTPTEPEPTNPDTTGAEQRVARLEERLGTIEQQLADIASRLVPIDTPRREDEQPPSAGHTGLAHTWFRPIKR
jgi:hypothetical protein